VKGLGLAAQRLVLSAAEGFFAPLRMTVGGDQLILVTPNSFDGFAVWFK
jgi:hypothetical protein